MASNQTELTPSWKELTTLSAEITFAIDWLRGAKTAKLREMRKNFTHRIVAFSPESVVALAKKIFRHDDHLHRWIAYELLYHHRGALRCLGEDDLTFFACGMASWMDVDSFGCYLSGPVWREKQVSDRFIHAWAHSPDRWVRRAALVSTVPLNLRSRGGKGDLERTLGVCRLLLHDRDDMVVKAMSWALRQVSFHYPKETEKFMEEHRGTLAARVLREVKNKLATGLKTPRRGRGTV